MAEFKIEDYIKSLNLQTDEEKKAAELLFAKPERVEEVKRGWNTVQEGSRIVTEAQTLKQQAEAAQRAAAEKEAANKAWFDSLKKYEDDAKATADKATAYEKYLADMGLTPEAVLTGSGVQPPARKAAEPAMDTKFLEENKQFRDQVTATATLLADLPFELQAISNRHVELYGTVPPPAVMRELKGKFLDPSNTKPLMEIASAELHFGEREKQAERAAHQEHVLEQLRVGTEHRQAHGYRQRTPGPAPPITHAAHDEEQCHRKQRRNEHLPVVTGRDQTGDVAAHHVRQAPDEGPEEAEA